MSVWFGKVPVSVLNSGVVVSCLSPSSPVYFNQPVCEIRLCDGSHSTVLSSTTGYFSPTVARGARVGSGAVIGFVSPNSSLPKSGLQLLKSRITSNQFQRLQRLSDTFPNSSFAEVIREVIERGLKSFNM